MTPPLRPSLFIDASAWVALCYPREGNHTTARAFHEGLKKSYYDHIHTSVHTLSEAYGWLLHHVSGRHALELLKRIERGITVHSVDAQLMRDAQAILQPKGAPPIELADVMNTLIMNRIGIRQIWSYDSDYTTLGYLSVG